MSSSPQPHDKLAVEGSPRGGSFGSSFSRQLEMVAKKREKDNEFHLMSQVRHCAAAPSPTARPRRACRGASALARRPTGRRPLPPPPAAPQIQELSRQLEAERTRIKLESGGEAGGRLIVVANRLPVTPVKNANGEWELKRSSGGLVSAFLGEPAPRSGWYSGRAEGVR